MERDKEAELKELEKIDKEGTKPPKGDVCPHCMCYVGDMPYMMLDPIRGWVECSRCGIVFSPKSFRDQKLEQSNARLIKKAPGLVIPAR